MQSRGSGVEPARWGPSALYRAAMNRTLSIAGVFAATTVLTGCLAKTIDKFTVKGVVVRSMQLPDADMACELGVSLRSALAAATSPKRPSRQALLISDMTAGMCDEIASLDAELDQALALSAAHGLDPVPRAVAAQDARLRADRLHERSATRYYRSWLMAQDAFGPYGEGCPKLKERDELPYFLGLFAGVQAVLHDSAAGGPVGVPKETLLLAGRASECLEDDKWWHVPQAIRGAVWATIPGSGPEGVDPWTLIADAADKSDPQGVRIARALQVTIAVNNGRDDVAREGILKHGEAIQAHAVDPDYQLLDRFSFLLSQFQSDLFWIAEEGHRTPVFGTLPGPQASEPAGPDPFGDDPFAADPFGGAPSGEPAAAPTDPPSAEEE